MNGVLSDLFFMVDNRTYHNDKVDKEEREQSLRENAELFVFLVGKLGETVTIEEVIEDYKARV